MDDPVFKTKYHKYKTKVKLWEKSFKEKHGRVPSKHDIREAPSSIRDSYKLYHKLKTSFLEETLSDALDEDSFDLSILDSPSQTDSSRLSTSFTDISTPDVSALTNSDNSIILQSNNGNDDSYTTITSNSMSQSFGNLSNAKEFQAEATNTLNVNAWITSDGTKANSKVTNANNASDKLRKSMSDKLFRQSSFHKRNPRKSWSRSSLNSSQSLSQSSLASTQKESLPDLETILSQKSKQQNENEEVEKEDESKIVDKDKMGVLPLPASTMPTPNLANQFDEEWLNRCNMANSIANDNNVNENGVTRPLVSIAASASTNQVKMEDKPKTFGISNINAMALAHLEQIQVIHEVGAKTMLSFDMGNLNLSAQNSLATAPNHSERNNSNGIIEDDDEEIANSEDETEMQASQRFQSIRNSNKRKYDQIDVESKINIQTKGVNPTVTNTTVVVTDQSKAVSVRRTKSKIKSKSDHDKTVSQAKSKANVATARRTSSRTTNKTKTYTELKVSDLNSDQNDDEEEDPFAGDDSDNDPNFSISQSPKSKAQRISYDLSSSSDGDDNVERVTLTPQPNAKKRVARVKTTVSKQNGLKKGERKVQAPRKKNEPAIKTNRNSTASENEPHQDTPDDYLIEFGMETIKSVPRIPVAELQHNTMEFSKYAFNATTKKPTTTADKTIEQQRRSSGKPKPLVTKNSIAREKLESKVAAGTLNDNYVRLNLRKKVFVRGKKTMNFSRYKKKLWKTKKAAALSGPDMDMGGCDGGILICFQCGLPGHFAQNCKAKSDRLLPLEAEEESPFPTLQEVQEMSNQQIKLTHTNRDVPLVDNPIWATTTDQEITPTTTTTEATETSSSVIESIDNPSESTTQNYIGHKIPEEFLITAGLTGNESDDAIHVKPLYKLNENGSVQETPAEVYDALAMFGHKQFRAGQEIAVMRILSGQSTLVTLSTGSGKSLCYQLPAYMYSRHKKCITLVISPLVSLMEDQVQGVPHFLNAQCLHTNLSEQKRATTIQLIKDGKVDVLLVSPEAIVSSEKSTGFGSILRDLPPVAFVCIDECHCVSQFGHNFRPSYLMVCRVLYEKLKIKTVLGLTATATISTRLSIVEHLRIPDGLDGVISDIPLPDNLTLTISCDDNRDIALVELLKEPRFVEYQSIIIYCSRRDECERVAKNLRTYFQDNIARELEQRNASGKRKRTLKTTIEPYHAGMAGSRRRTIQNQFMRGDLKIVVATIAFGMGINKADIRCVIHYNMPMNFESYVQEVGRAGRDAKPAHCHLFLDSKGEDKVELRRHIYANSIDRHIIRKLLHKIFIPCACKKSDQNAATSNYSDTIKADIDAVQNINWNDDDDDDDGNQLHKSTQRMCPGHEVCFSVDETVNELDIPEENISTLLCYLELHDQRYVKALSKAYIRCKVLSYGGSKALKNAAKKCPPLAMAIALDIRNGISHDNSTFIEFPVIEIASAIGWNSGVVKYQLKQLEWVTENGHSKRSNISVEFSDLGFRVLAPGDLSSAELDATLDMLYSRVKEQENNQINQLENVFHGLTSVAVKSARACAAVELNDERSNKLKKIVREYFQSNQLVQYAENIPEHQPDPNIDSLITSDIYTMISRYPENKFTGRNLARIFHGVQSPVFPAVIWSRCKYWRAHLKTDFNHIVKLANAVILKLRT